MDISENGLRLIESFEGFSAHAYWDSYGRVWTVGFGETNGVTSSSYMTRAQAEQDLRGRVARQYVPSITALGVELNQNQFDALCSFVWNLGVGSMTWDVGRAIRRKDFPAAGRCMLAYDHAGGVRLAGLTRRRQAEYQLFMTPARPPDPYNYAWYPVGPFAFRHKNGTQLALNERGTVQQYDRLWAAKQRDKKAINAIRQHITLLRDRVWTVAHAKDGVHWSDSRRLGWRFQRLSERQKGPVTTS